jgi:hypothetical protein
MHSLDPHQVRTMIKEFELTAAHKQSLRDQVITVDQPGLPLNPGQAMDRLYDFGDCWEFTIKLERIEPPGAKLKAPHILEKRGKAPRQYRDWDD